MPFISFKFHEVMKETVFFVSFKLDFVTYAGGFEGWLNFYTSRHRVVTTCHDSRRDIVTHDKL